MSGSDLVGLLVEMLMVLDKPLVHSGASHDGCATCAPPSALGLRAANLNAGMQYW